MDINIVRKHFHTDIFRKKNKLLLYQEDTLETNLTQTDIKPFWEDHSGMLLYHKQAKIVNQLTELIPNQLI